MNRGSLLCLPLAACKFYGNYFICTATGHSNQKWGWDIKSLKASFTFLEAIATVLLFIFFNIYFYLFGCDQGLSCVSDLYWDMQDLQLRLAGSSSLMRSIPGPPALGALSLSHWTTRDAPSCSHLSLQTSLWHSVVFESGIQVESTFVKGQQERSKSRLFC